MTTKDPDLKRIRNSGNTFRKELKRGGKVGMWQKLLDYYCPDGKCLACGENKTLQIDHVIPLGAGGRNELWNIQPICDDCNVAKGKRIIDYRPDGGKFAASLDPLTSENRGLVDYEAYKQVKILARARRKALPRPVRAPSQHPKTPKSHNPKLQIVNSIGAPEITYSDVSLAFMCPICGREHYAYNREVERECGGKFILRVELIDASRQNEQ